MIGWRLNVLFYVLQSAACTVLPLETPDFQITQKEGYLYFRPFVMASLLNQPPWLMIQFRIYWPLAHGLDQSGCILCDAQCSSSRLSYSTVIILLMLRIAVWCLRLIFHTVLVCLTSFICYTHVHSHTHAHTHACRHTCVRLAVDIVDSVLACILYCCVCIYIAKKN